MQGEEPVLNANYPSNDMTITMLVLTLEFFSFDSILSFQIHAGKHFDAKCRNPLVKEQVFSLSEILLFEAIIILQQNEGLRDFFTIA